MMMKMMVVMVMVMMTIMVVVVTMMICFIWGDSVARLILCLLIMSLCSYEKAGRLAKFSVAQSEISARAGDGRPAASVLNVTKVRFTYSASSGGFSSTRKTQFIRMVRITNDSKYLK